METYIRTSALIKPELLCTSVKYSNESKRGVMDKVTATVKRRFQGN